VNFGILWVFCVLSEASVADFFGFGLLRVASLRCYFSSSSSSSSFVLGGIPFSYVGLFSDGMGWDGKEAFLGYVFLTFPTTFCTSFLVTAVFNAWMDGHLDDDDADDR
jgi:hypothetical protein